MLNGLMGRVEKLISQHRTSSQGDLKKLRTQEVQLQNAIDNLLNLAESGNISSEAFGKRLSKNESELEAVRAQLSSLSGRGKSGFKFDRGMVLKRLSKIPAMAKAGPDGVRETQLMLKKLYPEKLRVHTKKQDGKTVFKIFGKAMLFNAVDIWESSKINNCSIPPTSIL
jgi:SMC interacting uncharacterized protein involved in chromosome segregation